MSWSQKPFLSSIVILWAVAVSGCFPQLAGKWEYTEEQRVKSANNETEAVRLEGSAGATTSTVTLIHLVQSGGKIPEAERKGAVFAADHIKNLALSWPKENILDIAFDEARIFEFVNHWRHPNGTIVEVRLRPSNPETLLSTRDKMPLGSN